MIITIVFVATIVALVVAGRLTGKAEYRIARPFLTLLIIPAYAAAGYDFKGDFLVFGLLPLVVCFCWQQVVFCHLFYEQRTGAKAKDFENKIMGAAAREAMK